MVFFGDFLSLQNLKVASCKGFGGSGRLKKAKKNVVITDTRFRGHKFFENWNAKKVTLRAF